MALLLYSLIRRHMKRTGRYFVPEDKRPPLLLRHLPPAEHLIGWYENPAPWDGVLVAFTESAFYSVDESGVVRIPLADIIEYETPKKSLSVEGVRLRTKDGVQFLRVAGTHEQRIDSGIGNHTFSDAWNLVQVLHAIVGRTERIG